MNDEKKEDSLHRHFNSEIYSDNVILNASQGHGFAAERINDYYDKATGKSAEIIGGNNAKNGADRLVDGQFIQTKYCKSAIDSVSACFEKNQFRYLTSDGSPMQIEVPYEQHDEAIKIFEKRIERGEVAGISDKSKAKDIIRKGHFTYLQAKNVTEFCTIESLTYDSVTGTITASYQLGVTGLITFASSIFSGKSSQESLSNAIDAGFSVAGDAFINNLLTSQVGRLGIDKSLRTSSDFIVKNLGTKASAKLVNSLKSKDSAIYGAAANSHLSKLIRGSVVTIVVGTVWASRNDLADIFYGRVSGAQLSKNMITNLSSATGGTTGFMAGAALGAQAGSIVPVAGNIVGGLLGGITAASISSKLVGSAVGGVLSLFIENDEVMIIPIVEMAFIEACHDYTLTNEEATDVRNKFSNLNPRQIHKDMYARYSESERSALNYAYSIFEQMCITKLASRPVITLPKANDVTTYIKEKSGVEVSAEVIDESINQVQKIVPKSIRTLDDMILGYADYLNEGNRVLAYTELTLSNRDDKVGSRCGIYGALIFFDTTIFKTARSGLVLSDCIICSYGHAGGTVEYVLSDIETIEVSKYSNEIVINDNIRLKFIHTEFRDKVQLIVECIDFYINQFK